MTWELTRHGGCEFIIIVNVCIDLEIETIVVIIMAGEMDSVLVYLLLCAWGCVSTYSM